MIAKPLLKTMNGSTKKYKNESICMQLKLSKEKKNLEGHVSIFFYVNNSQAFFEIQCADREG